MPLTTTVAYLFQIQTVAAGIPHMESPKQQCLLPYYCYNGYTHPYTPKVTGLIFSFTGHKTSLFFSKNTIFLVSCIKGSNRNRTSVCKHKLWCLCVCKAVIGSSPTVHQGLNHTPTTHQNTLFSYSSPLNQFLHPYENNFIIFPPVFSASLHL